jgi:hypothetical protein
MSKKHCVLSVRVKDEKDERDTGKKREKISAKAKGGGGDRVA